MPTDEPDRIPLPRMTLCQGLQFLQDYHAACVEHFKDDAPKRERHEHFRDTVSEARRQFCRKEKKAKESLPVLQEVLFYASEVRLPEAEGRKFFAHFESVGWKMAGKSKISNWRARLDLWKEHWEERIASAPTRGGVRREDFSQGGF